MVSDWFLYTHSLFILTQKYVQTYTEAAWLINVLLCKLQGDVQLLNWSCMHCSLFWILGFQARCLFIYFFDKSIAGYSDTWCISFTRHRMLLDLQRWWSAPSVWPVSPGIIRLDFSAFLSGSLLAAQLWAAGCRQWLSGLKARQHL